MTERILNVNNSVYADSSALEKERPADIYDGAVEGQRPFKLDAADRLQRQRQYEVSVPAGHIALQGGYETDYPGPTGW